MSNKKTNKPKLEIPGQEKKELTPAELKKSEKERKREERYWNSMITRKEALELARGTARKEVSELVEIIRDPMRAGLVQSLAITELLKDKGLTKNDAEFQKYIDKVVKDLEKYPEGEGGKDESAEKEEGN